MYVTQLASISENRKNYRIKLLFNNITPICYRTDFNIDEAHI